MEIVINKENTALTIGIVGRLDTLTSPELDRAVTENLDGVTELVFDLAGMEYTSSAGLRVFLKAQKLMNARGSMKLTNVSGPVMEILEITGFTDIMTIE